jgi:hypothetical protein
MSVAAAEVDVDYFSDAFLAKAAQVFLHPSRLLPWDDIVPRAVAQNTFRGFHRVDKALSGAKEAFVGFFIKQRVYLLDAISTVSTRDDLDQLCNEICHDIRDRLANCSPTQLQSYNKVRKPADLYIEHLIAMAKEVNNLRVTLVPLLFLPLDSQILSHPGIFTESELHFHGLSRGSTYKDISGQCTYEALQVLLANKASAISEARRRPFYVIYFDLIWNDRFRNDGANLFETNVGLTSRCS